MKDNKLIADFMGLKKYGYKDENYLVLNNHLSPAQIPYHTSWDWLMPVVQNIEQDCEGVPQEMLNISLYSDINEVYKAVIDFIKNQNN
jgi:hypothetical protein